MKLNYDNRLKIAGIGIVPWARLGLEQWFPDFKIASYYDWDILPGPGVPEVIALTRRYPDAQLPKLNSKALLASEQFKSLLHTELPAYQFVTYKPIGLGTPRNSNAAVAARLENKAEFRRLMQAQGIPFPDFAIYDGTAISSMHADQLLQGRQRVVLQDAKLSGGKGTFVVFDEASLATALTAIQNMGSGKEVVVSTLVEGARERSIQACVTRYGVFMGPLQKQIIAEPALANVEVPGSTKFCGAEIDPSDPLADVRPEIAAYTQKIGLAMQQMGYKGIFGVDCLVDESGKVYVLEVNARLTGVTPLLTMLHREGHDIPFALLHTLEVLDAEYHISDSSADPTPPCGALLIVQAQGIQTAQVTKNVPSGRYMADGFRRVDGNIHFAAESKDRLVVQQYTPEGTMVKPGGRLACIYMTDTVLDAQEKLSPQARTVVNQVRNEIALT